jgi:hypothetical protein
MGASKVGPCDICAVKEPVRRFYLVSYVKKPRPTRRGVGSIVLCARCWNETAAKRRRPRPDTVRWRDLVAA